MKIRIHISNFDICNINFILKFQQKKNSLYWAFYAFYPWELHKFSTQTGVFIWNIVRFSSPSVERSQNKFFPPSYSHIIQNIKQNAKKLRRKAKKDSSLQLFLTYNVLNRAPRPGKVESLDPRMNPNKSTEHIRTRTNPNSAEKNSLNRIEPFWTHSNPAEPSWIRNWTLLNSF